MKICFIFIGAIKNTICKILTLCVSFSDITKTAGTHKPAQAAMSPQPESQGPRRNMMKKKGGAKKKKGSGW